jgi:poly(A) polymerase
MEAVESEHHITTATSPLDGQALIALLGIRPGPLVGKIKNTLTDAVVSGDLAPDDAAGAERMARDLLWRMTGND